MIYTAMTSKKVLINRIILKHMFTRIEEWEGNSTKERGFFCQNEIK